MSSLVDKTNIPGARSDNRRQTRRVVVAGVAVLRSGEQAPSVWCVTNLSAGGAALRGDGTLFPGRLALSLHVAGFPVLELGARMLRRQLVTRGGRCAVEFVDLSESQRAALRAMTSVEETPSSARRRALVVGLDEARTGALSRELTALGFAARFEPSPGQAAAWLQKEPAEVLLLDESVIAADRWSLLQFARDTAPETRRFVLADDVRGFRLYYAIKAGLVDGLLEHPLAAEGLARRLLGDAAEPRAARRRAARGG
jgi:hypothetical protein